MDAKWASHSVGASSARPDIVELVVDNGAVTEIRDGLPPVAIPLNGFVAVTRKKEDGSHPFGAAFKPGARASFRVTLSPTLDDAVMHVEGASILVRDGKIPSSFSYVPKDLESRNPRTMIGVSRDGSELIMAVVDGRQSSSIGLDTAESAEFMLSIGAHNALNLDGGGSTTMVARSPGEFDVSAVNSFSDASMRRVINGIGVFTDAPQASIRSIIVEAAEYNVFVGTNRQFSVKAADRFGNPVEVDPSDVVWSVSGFRGAIKNGLLKPRTAGDGFVSARIGRATAKVAVKSLSGPAELALSKTSLSLGAGEAYTFAVTGRDGMGFSARINPADISWAATGGIGTIDKGVFMRSGDGAAAGYVTAALADARAYCAVQAAPADAGGAGAGAAGTGASSAAGGGAAPAPAVELPAATRIKDAAAVRADYAPAAGAVRMGVLGEAGNPATGAEKAANAAFLSLAGGSELELGALVGYGNHGGAGGGAQGGAAGGAQGKTVATNSDFAARESVGGNRDVKLLQLSTVGNGIRAAGIYQWGSLLDELENFDGKELFIVMQQSPSTFNDKLEAALFKERLAHYAKTKGYGVWVFYSGEADAVWLEDGVRYFSCAGARAPGVDADTGAGARYLRVVCQNGAVTYSYEPLV
ncbi:MAG: phosphodiester glycosidase family protein [Clostridiales bacterium]|nr:phosphodiester glycosidase family protein [Clostridiales bacterium]